MLYCDTSFLVAMFAPDVFNARVQHVLLTRRPRLLVTDFAMLELVSAIARRLRTGQLALDGAVAAIRNAEIWCDAHAIRRHVNSLDVAWATAAIARLDLNLRGPDAIHVSCCVRLGLPLLTFDLKMAEAASAIGIVVVDT